MQRLRKDDDVVVIAGKDKGKRGKVAQVLSKSDRVIVHGINIVTKHVKPARDNQKGSIEKREAAIHQSNVMLVDPTTSAPTRIRIVTLQDGRRVRVAKKSGEQFDK